MTLQNPNADVAPINAPARVVPMPATISPEAAAYLAFMNTLDVPGSPAPENLEAWTAVSAATNAPEAADAIGMATTGAFFDDTPTDDSVIERDGWRICTSRPIEPLREDLTLFFIHGGGFIAGSGEATRRSARFLANSYKVPVWSTDYRQPPQYRFPIGLDDVLESYRMLLERTSPEKIVVGGMSGGANFSASLMLRLRADGLPRPAGLILNSPPVDGFVQGDTVVTNSFSNGYNDDSLSNTFRFYAAGADLADPYISPIFGEIDSTWPTTLLISGTRDVLLSDTVRFHRKILDAGVAADLHVFEGAPHGFFGGYTPDDRLPAEQVRRFLAAI